MAILQQVVLYVFLFVGIYFQVFILFTYLLNRHKIKADGARTFLRPESEYPSATIIIPCWNEEKTVGKTIESLLCINYPKDKLHLVVVNDGSTDNTGAIIDEYKKKFPEIETYHKENGGKHTAVNYGIMRATTDLVGCLDADSFVDKDALKKIACVFLTDAEAMAVTPAMKINHPKTFVQVLQSAEYIFGILVKKVMSLLGAIHVTPGPFTIFRRDVFEKIGLFRSAHNTEDMEIAFRMQAHHLKIENVHDAWVYTTGPSTIKTLYKQRLRWTYGFLQNARDYKYLFFNKKYGNIGLITLPVAFILILGVLFSASFIIYRILSFIVRKFIEWKTVGFLKPHFTMSLFYVSTKSQIFLIVSIYLLMITLLFSAYRLTNEKIGLGKAIILYFIIYPIVSPFWIIKSIYNSLFSKKTSWR